MTGDDDATTDDGELVLAALRAERKRLLDRITEIDMLLLGGQEFSISVTRTDGTVERVPVTPAADGTWTYLVPDGVRLVSTHEVQAGDTVSGKIEVSVW
jgi:hypothetical protein